MGVKQYCIYRYEKCKSGSFAGRQKENNRKEEDRESVDFWRSSIDWNKTYLNVYFKRSENLREDVMNEINQLEQFKDGKKPRKDAVLYLDHLVTASPEYFQGKSREEAMKYFKKAFEEIEKEWGHVVNAVVHFDETTPHMHVQTVPITKDGRLSAKELCGNKAQYQATQDWFYENIGQEFNLCRGEPKEETQRKHLETAAYKRKMDEEKAEKAREQLNEINHLLKKYSRGNALSQKLEDKKAGFFGGYTLTEKEFNDVCATLKNEYFALVQKEADYKKLEREYDVAHEGWSFQIKLNEDNKIDTKELEELRHFKEWTEQFENLGKKPYDIFREAVELEKTRRKKIDISYGDDVE